MKNGAHGIEVIEITGGERERLLVLEEGHFAELKSVDISPKRLTKTISAFANAAGGELYIGILETEILGVKSHYWRGFGDQEAANGHLQAFVALFPLGAEYSYEFLRALGSNGLILHVSVQRTAGIVRALDKKIYRRHGAQNLEVTGKIALGKLRLEKGIESYENEAVNVAVSFVAESDIIKGFVKQVVPNQTPIQFLTKQNLIRGNKPIVAAVLLFADEPQAAFPKHSGIKLFRHKTRGAGSRETLADQPTSVEGSLYSLIKNSVAATVAMVEGIEKLGPSGLEPVKYPFETLHEIVTNAILHRDYSIAADIQIRIFDNRIEVESPGLLPGHVTVKNILNEQFARNGKLVRLINKFPEPPNKDVGEGLNTAFKAMQKLRLKPPTIEEKDSSLLVTIRHEPLASPEESVMGYLENHKMITNRIAREITGIASENSMKDVFYRLAASKLIERVPGRRGPSAAWQRYTHSSGLSKG